MWTGLTSAACHEHDRDEPETSCHRGGDRHGWRLCPSLCYFAMVQQNITKTLRNDSLKPLHRLRQWFDIQFDFLKQADFRNGCLIGNFSAEVGPHSDMINAKLIKMYAEIHGSVVYCLKAAVKSGELPATVDCKEVAHFLYSSLQGAILQAKVERSPLPLKRFIKIAFSTILR